MKVQDVFWEFLHIFDPMTKDQQNFQTIAAKFLITATANNGSGWIRVTAPGHGLKDLDRVYISGVLGTTEANNSSANPNWQIQWVDANTFDLINSTFLNAWSAPPSGVAYGVGALVGTVDGDKLPKERLLQAYNQARVALIADALIETKGDTNEVSSIMGAQTVVETIRWSQTGSRSMAARPLGLIKFYSMTSPTGVTMVLRSENALPNVLRGDSFYAQSSEVIYFFLQGKSFVHYGPYVPTPTAFTIGGATNATPIMITAAGNDFVDGQLVNISGVLGNTNANGDWQIGNVQGGAFTLIGSSANGDYTGGGMVRPRYMISYLGITDWSLDDIVLGSAEETIVPLYIPKLLQRAVEIARTFGSGMPIGGNQ